MKAEQYLEEMRKNDSTEFVDVHREGSPISKGCYRIFRNGNVKILDPCGKLIKDGLSMANLKGDYSLYGDTTLFECGYLLLDVASRDYKEYTFNEIRDILTKAFGGSQLIDFGFNGRFNGHGDVIERTLSHSGLTVSIYTIPSYSKENYCRKASGKRCFPFDPSISEVDGYALTIKGPVRLSVSETLHDRIHTVKNLILNQFDRIDYSVYYIPNKVPSGIIV